MLTKILIGVAVVVVLFVVVVATRPAAYHVVRKRDVAAPPEAVFGVLNDLRQFAGVWVLFDAPFEVDPTLQKTIEGPAAGVGQSYAWTGKDVGKGKITIAESVPAQKVGMKVDFVEPMASTSTYSLDIAPSPTGSQVTWSTNGSHNFIGKAFGLFVDMDKMLGGDLEKGLAQLKTVAERKTLAPVP